MIRRQVGNEFWLIPQHEHALISGKLAEQLGNKDFAKPSSASAVLGIGLHDCGWVVHDDEPTLNASNIPIDVFETTRPIGLRVWDESAERATARDDYAGLLVSLHSLALSVFVTEQAPISGKAWDLSETRARFEINRFQHKMIELQESLRSRLGMRNDRPLRHGLAEESLDPKEQRLAFDFRWLQAMDRLSLAICCTASPFKTIDSLHPRAGAATTSIRIERANDQLVTLDPWPFAATEITVQVPFRRLDAKPFTSVADFRARYGRAAVENFTATVRAHTI
ncbi:MAG TPA: DUF3891 family protein [Tepidisphaeraceae bacterium]|jgi:hypothetical protein